MTQPAADRPLLVAEDLSKWYGRQLGCRDVSFELYEGEVIAVVGESGSGKTTLLQLLSSQLEPSRGRVSYRLRDGTTRDHRSARPSVVSSTAPTGATFIRIRPWACA